MKSDLYFEIFRRFKEAGIEIPFPRRDLHIRSVTPDARFQVHGGAPAPAALPDSDEQTSSLLTNPSRTGRWDS